jgi:hypothetical protein
MDYSVLIIIATVFVSRFIQMGAFKTLSDEDKVKVLSGSVMKLSKIMLITTIIMIAVFYFTISAFPTKFKPISISFLGAILFQRILAYFLTRKNMVENGVSKVYISKHFYAWFVTTAGVVVFVYAMISNLF